jgi:two-component system, OmpR family, manganese sensing sensor histidine kinase
VALPKLKGLRSTKQGKVAFEARIPSFTSQNSKIQHKRLLFAYLMAMAVIFGTSATGVYFFLTRSFNHELNNELLTLAKTAVPFLKTVKTQEFQSSVKAVGSSLETVKTEREHSLEWFNPNGELLAKEGTSQPNLPLVKDFSPPSHLNEGSWVIQQQGRFRVLTMPVYNSDRQEKTLRLEGYIRASESTAEMEKQLGQFRLGLGLGGITALILSGISGLCLTKLAIEPIKQSIERLIQFTADASHKLRNPLTAIGTTVELMQSHPEKYSPSDTKKLEIINSANAQLTHLVEDLLFLARTDAMVALSWLESSPVPLDEVLEDVVERFELIAHSKRINFHSDLPTGIFVKGDANQLLRLFSNLVENALKYTKAHGKVSLSLVRRKRFAAIAVEDTGRGIACEYLPLIFDRFWQVEKVQSQQKESVGLGLAIVLAIVQRHRGKIKVSSKLGVGSCFEVYLPLASNIEISQSLFLRHNR